MILGNKSFGLKNDDITTNVHHVKLLFKILKHKILKQLRS
jgi:hypothetical protein